MLTFKELLDFWSCLRQNFFDLECCYFCLVNLLFLFPHYSLSSVVERLPCMGTSLVAQWVRLQATTAGLRVQCVVGDLRSHMLWCGQKIKREWDYQVLLLCSLGNSENINYCIKEISGLKEESRINPGLFFL